MRNAEQRPALKYEHARFDILKHVTKTIELRPPRYCKELTDELGG
jgi:hypothetical protein